MAAQLPSWLTNAADAMRRLADRPCTLFCLLLALNAIARPCSITAHDARLYSLQALNQAEHGTYADDVFLRYGSQDQFSLFSRLAGPMVAVLGLRPAFFVLYLVVNTLLILALFRLVRTLIDDSAIATVALIYLVTAPLSYGGADIFTVHEQFFTPRTVGTALTLFALERLLRQQFAAALLLLVAGALIHPLMAFGGVMIWAGYLACTYAPMRAFAALTIAALMGGVMLLSVAPLSQRIFGTMDDDWHRLIRLSTGFHYPDSWSPKDWINFAVSFAVPIIACVTLYVGDPVRQRFCLILTLAGVVGFAVHVAATYLPYALLFQGQPYRVLWILKVFQVPLGFLLIARWSQSPMLAAKATALAFLAFFCVVHYLAQEWMIFAMAMTVSLLVSRLSALDADRAWWWYGAARGLIGGAIGWMAYRWWFFVMEREVIALSFDLNEWVLFDLVSPFFLLVAVCVVARYWPASPNFRATLWASLSVAILLPIALFVVEASPAIRREHSRLGGDIEFMRAFVHAHEPDARRHPQIYCSHGRADLIWIDVQATSYFSIIQTAGIMFNRQTAAEIERRCTLVANFEMAQQRAEMLFPDEAKKVGMEALFKVSFNCPEPSEADLIRLCQEPGLDYVVIPQEFPGLYSASNGRLFVYECYKIRESCTFSARMAPCER
jgi:hypothetical protein